MQILPIKELKNTAEISEKCHSSGEPLFITKNGYGDMVIMSMEIYEKKFAMEKIYSELAISQKQFENGECKDAKDALNSIGEKYGL